MITAIVRYKLPSSISYEDCREHFFKIAPNFQKVPGLLSKHFICDIEGKFAGGVYQWDSQEAAESFYTGPWQDGIVERYGMKPEINFFDVFAVTNNLAGEVKLFSSNL